MATISIRQPFRCEPRMIRICSFANYFHGLIRRRVGTVLRSGIRQADPGLIDRVMRDNPADLLLSTDLRPGELAIYVNYPELDHYNFDAQDESFVWLASQRGIHLEVTEVIGAGHNLAYIEGAEPVAYQWLGRHIPAPIPRHRGPMRQSGPTAMHGRGVWLEVPLVDSLRWLLIPAGSLASAPSVHEIPASTTFPSQRCIGRRRRSTTAQSGSFGVLAAIVQVVVVTKA